MEKSCILQAAHKIQGMHGILLKKKKRKHTHSLIQLLFL